ncbi:MAG: hypothetical protein HC848_02085 [Limnobacter sp.]|nr:hypothetical protein [Limnobacter sp.]
MELASEANDFCVKSRTRNIVSTEACTSALLIAKAAFSGNNASAATTSRLFH